MATPELRHMLRDDDLNHEEQKQVLELAIRFHNDRFYHQPFAGPQAGQRHRGPVHHWGRRRPVTARRMASGVAGAFSSGSR